MYTAVEPLHGHFSYHPGNSALSHNQDTSNAHRAMMNQQPHYQQLQQGAASSASSSSSSSAAASAFMNGGTPGSQQDYYNTLTDAQVAEFFADAGRAARVASVDPSGNNGGAMNSYGNAHMGNAAMAGDGMHTGSQSGTPSSHLSPAEMGINVPLPQDPHGGLRQSAAAQGSARSSIVGTVPSHLMSEMHQLQATPTQQSPFVGASASLHESPLSSSPTVLHNGSPMGQYQQLQHRQGSRDQTCAIFNNTAGRSNLVPGRSNSGASTSGAVPTSRGPSPGPKSEVGISDRGMPSPQDLDKDGDTGGEKRQSNRFVYKLMKMVSDPESQHLISFNPSGTSVVVTNFDDFAKDVLPKHFKHSNFSSFIRQLNMYGFYKVNKTPRGQRNSNDMQVWEFSHPKFIKGRADLLDEIRRKALDNDHGRGEARDLQFNMSMGQMQLRHHLEEVQWRLDQTMEQNMQLRDFSLSLRKTLIDVLEYVKVTNGGQLPFDVNLPGTEMLTSMTPMMSSGSFMGGNGAGDGGWDGLPQQPNSVPLHGHQQDGPSIFVTEPSYATSMGGGPSTSMGGGLQMSSLPPSPNHDGGGAFSMAQFQHVSPLGSRRVSNTSLNGRDVTSSDLLDPNTGGPMPTVLNQSGVPIMMPPSTASGRLGGGDVFNSTPERMMSRDSRPMTAPQESPLGRGIASMPRRSFSRQNSGLAVDTTPSFVSSPDGDRGSWSAVEVNSTSAFGDGTPGSATGPSPHHPSMIPPGQRGQMLLQQGGGLFASAVNTPLPPSPAPPHHMQMQMQMQNGAIYASPIPDGMFGFHPPPLPQHHPHQQQQQQGPHHGLGLAVGTPGSGGVSPHMMSNGFGNGAPHHGEAGLGLSYAGSSVFLDDGGAGGGAGGGGGVDGGGMLQQPNAKAMRTPLKRTASSSADQAAMARAAAMEAALASVGKRKTAS